MTASTTRCTAGYVLANPDLNKMAAATDLLQSWTGGAAMEFAENFLHPFPSISANQFMMVLTMKGALEAYRAMCEEAREDIKRIAVATRDQLDHARECTSSDWSELLKVAAAVAAVGGAATTTGPGAVFAMIGAATAIGDAVNAQPGEANSVSITGDYTPDIIESMSNAVDTLTAEISETQKRIADAVVKSTTLVQEKNDYFAFPRPKLAGMPGEQITTGAGLGTST